MRDRTSSLFGTVLIRHFHTARHTLLMNIVASPWEVGLSVIRGKMVFSLDELTGNIRMAKLKGRSKFFPLR